MTKQLKISILIAILNIIDGICTNFLVGNNLAWESNPLMRIVMSKSIDLFFCYKFIVALLVITLGLMEDKIINITLRGLLMLYTIVCINHLFCFIKYFEIFH